MKNIAIIPARSGSKRLPDKNIRLLAGKPLMGYTIEAAIKSKCFDTVMVSTDMEIYAEIAKNFGAEVPFIRAKELAEDDSNSWDVVKFVLDEYFKIGQNFDIVTLLQPTSPLRQKEDISNAYELFVKKDAKAIVSVCEVDHSPLWSNTLPKDNSMEKFVLEEKSMQSQKLDTYYRINGAIYMINCNFFNEDKNIYRKGCYAYIMDRRRSIDIDAKLDFDLAEFMLNTTNCGGHDFYFGTYFINDNSRDCVLCMLIDNILDSYVERTGRCA